MSITTHSGAILESMELLTPVGGHLGGVAGLLDVISDGVVQTEGQVRSSNCITHYSNHQGQSSKFTVSQNHDGGKGSHREALVGRAS